MVHQIAERGVVVIVTAILLLFLLLRLRHIALMGRRRGLHNLVGAALIVVNRSLLLGGHFFIICKSLVACVTCDIIDAIDITISTSSVTITSIIISIFVFCISITSIVTASHASASLLRLLLLHVSNRLHLHLTHCTPTVTPAFLVHCGLRGLVPRHDRGEHFALLLAFFVLIVVVARHLFVIGTGVVGVLCRCAYCDVALTVCHCLLILRLRNGG
mmetsp:Transcript_26395/g.44572  ORF Transcript_26395/g.44572 Transcript_26395/m.44572 type:complete len:216 (+) Transcript_26395:2071-2718(+)